MRCVSMQSLYESVGAVALADFKPPFETPLNDVQIKKAQQLTRALAEPGRFLQALRHCPCGWRIIVKSVKKL